ncbi:UDP-glucosyltransferase [Bacillus pacificus]|uniref:macrolide family glycosyltransferase n=1 Tax=Bacillus cereus group TaxID=86661 RepID=UPI000789DD03|nr:MULTISPECIES: macrolide family glycosyltransferase [Bacillus cereus group]ASI78066.1 UDP-glucosyltransferase [Bacillus cereus]KYP99431.1 putative glycosyl transferase [Bacillus cereus]MCC2349144.1 UDP-glucosyltransferase [Bacillus pacificus]MCC2468000.1 UDP-glucosyltransferase [Bacillus pacificus]MCC2485106.1 UDP-glucosyltransferase [Bacillus pacificus]
MLNILVVNFPAEGHVNPTLSLVKAYTERGDHVHYITTEQFKDRIEDLGAIVYTHPDLLKEISIDSETLDGLNSFFRVHVQTSLYILEIVKQLCENIHFDFVIYDIFGAGELVKEYLQIPGIVSSPIFLIPTEFLETLPFHPNAAIPFRPDEISEQLLYQMDREFGVKPKNNLQFMHNKGDVTLVYTSRYFQPNSDSFGENNIFIGPSISKRKINVEFPLESLKDKKVIYISMGTLLEGIEPFFNACIDAFSDFNGLVVMAIGDRNDRSKIKEAPNNFVIAPYVPQSEVLSEADVFITHGGMNSVHDAIHFNVPFVIIPHDKDQPMIAQRLTELEAAHRLLKENVNVQTLKEAVTDVLSNEKYKHGIRKLKDSFLDCGGSNEAITVITSLLNK